MTITATGFSGFQNNLTSIDLGPGTIASSAGDRIIVIAGWFDSGTAVTQPSTGMVTSTPAKTFTKDAEFLSGKLGLAFYSWISDGTSLTQTHYAPTAGTAINGCSGATAKVSSTVGTVTYNSTTKGTGTDSTSPLTWNAGGAVNGTQVAFIASLIDNGATGTWTGNTGYTTINSFGDGANTGVNLEQFKVGESGTPALSIAYNAAITSAIELFVSYTEPGGAAAGEASFPFTADRVENVLPGETRPYEVQTDLYWFDAGTAVSITTNQTLTATQTQTATITNSVGKILSATETQTPTIVKQVGHIVPTVTQTQTPTIVKSVGKILSATETQTPTLAAAKTIVTTLSAVQVQTASMVRSVGKILSATETQTPTIVKSVGKTLSATETQTPVLAASRAFLKALSATQTQTASIVRSVGKVLTATETQTPTVARSIGKILSATQTQVRSITKSVGKVLSAVSAQVASLAAVFHAGVPDAPIYPPLSTTFTDDGVRLTSGATGAMSTTNDDDGRRTTQFLSNGVTYTENLNP